LHISAVEFIADPAETGDLTTLRIGDAQQDSVGIYDWFFDRSYPGFDTLLGSASDLLPFYAGSLPSSIATRTMSICNKNDVVCDWGDKNSLGIYVFNFHVSTGVHSAYKNDLSQLAPLGDQAATQLYSDSN
jgi:hypothetical protein